jgi:hypothetical protein
MDTCHFLLVRGLQAVFLWLAFFNLYAIREVRRLDLMEEFGHPGFKSGEN